MNAKLKTVFMGSPEFAVPCLRVLAKETDLRAVYTQPDRPAHRGQKLTPPAVKLAAVEMGIPVFQPERVSRPEEVARLQALAPDLIVVVAYGQLLKSSVLEVPRLGCVNVHASLLPRWRGAAPIQWAILAGDSETGVATMKMVLKLDAGPMIHVRRTPISPVETTSTLHDRLSLLGAEVLSETLARAAQSPLPEMAQDETLVTYASKLTKELANLDLTRDAAELDRTIRALNPWPGARVRLASGEILKILDAKLHRATRVPPSTLARDGGALTLGVPGGSLELVRVQLEGKPPMDATGFFNGLQGRGIALPLRVESVK